jgi:glycogen synthase
MKIVHVETGRHFYGGAQQVLWLLEGLAARGVDNLLVCPPASGIDKAARDAGIPVRNLGCTGDLDLRFAWQLGQLARGERPDIVHCHSRRGADFLGGQAIALTGIPAVLSRRVDHTESGWLARSRYRPFRKVIAISEHIATVLVDGGIDPQKAVIAQFIPRKGHRYLFDVVPNLRDNHPNVRVLLFGSGPGEADLRALANRLNLFGTLQFAGFREDLDDYLACIDLLVHPAVKEGLGVAMLKAAAAGVPVLAFDTAGAREAVLHGKTGVLVPPEDTAKLQKAVALLIDEPEMRLELGAAGRQRMKDEFPVATMVDRHIDLYESVING